LTNYEHTGLCVSYTKENTPDKGQGLLAAAAIRRGTIVWRHAAGQYAVYDEQSFKSKLSNMSHGAALHELTHVFCVAEFPGYMIRVFDDGELINHSDQPTLVVTTSSGLYEAPEVTSTQDVATALLNNHFTLIASRDIEAGEELALDYNADPDDPQYYSDLCEEYGVSWEWL